MTPLEIAGTLSLGALGIVALLFGLAMYVTRGHRWDLSGIRIVRSEAWRPDGRPFGAMPKSSPLCLQVMPGEGMAHHVCRLPHGHTGRHEGDDGSYWQRTVDWSDIRVTGDSDRPPATIQHGQRTRGDDE